MWLELLVFTLSAACLAVPLYWVYRRYMAGGLPSPVEPVWILILFILLGVNLKLFYIQFIRPDDVVALLFGISDKMLQEGGLEVFVPGLVAILVAMGAFFTGYSADTGIFRFSPAIKNYEINLPRLKIVVALLLSVSLLAFLCFVLNEYWTAVGANDLTRKRFNSIEGGSTNRLLHLKYYAYKFSTFARYGFYLLLIYFLLQKDKVSNQTLAMLFVLFIVTVFAPSYFSNRAHVFVLLFDISIIFFLNYSRKNTMLYATLVVLSFAIIVTTTFYRQSRMAPKAKVIASERSQVKKYKKNIDKYLPARSKKALKKAEARIKAKELNIRQKTKELNEMQKKVELQKNNSTAPKTGNLQEKTGQQIAAIAELVTALVKNENVRNKLALYKRCRVRIARRKINEVRFADRTDHPYWRKRAYWIKRADKLATPGSGNSSWPVQAINTVFPPDNKRDICSGGLDVIANPAAAKPLSPLSGRLLGRVERFVQGRYFIDILKTTHLVRKVPSEMGYLYGQSLVGWVFAPVPRSLWVRQTVVSAGAASAGDAHLR